MDYSGKPFLARYYVEILALILKCFLYISPMRNTIRTDIIIVFFFIVARALVSQIKASLKRKAVQRNNVRGHTKKDSYCAYFFLLQEMNI